MGTREDGLTEEVILKALAGGGYTMGNSPWDPFKGWMVLPHVRCQTGYGESRAWCDIKTRKFRRRYTDATIDALAFNAWPSQGHQIHGLEIKLSRADWLRELRDPVKTEIMRRQVDKLYVLAPPGVVCPKKDAGILGTQWGHYEISIVPQPTHREWPLHQRLRFYRKHNCKLWGSAGVELPRSFVGAILRANLKEQEE